MYRIHKNFSSLPYYFYFIYLDVLGTFSLKTFSDYFWFRFLERRIKVLQVVQSRLVERKITAKITLSYHQQGERCREVSKKNFLFDKHRLFRIAGINSFRWRNDIFIFLLDISIMEWMSEYIIIFVNFTLESYSIYLVIFLNWLQ